MWRSRANSSALKARLPDVPLKSSFVPWSAPIRVVRLKGRVWLRDKALPLQIQMVGPRLDSWFEAAPAQAWRPDGGCGGVDLVVLGFSDDLSASLAQQLQRLVSATPETPSTAAVQSASAEA